MYHLLFISTITVRSNFLYFSFTGNEDTLIWWWVALLSWGFSPKIITRLWYSYRYFSWTFFSFRDLNNFSVLLISGVISATVNYRIGSFIFKILCFCLKCVELNFIIIITEECWCVCVWRKHPKLMTCRVYNSKILLWPGLQGMPLSRNYLFIRFILSFV